MQFASLSTLLEQAKVAWEHNKKENRRIVLLHALPALGLPLVVMVINLILDAQLAGTGGLSGIGMRSTLQTIQTVLSDAIGILLPFWQLGLIACAMGISQGHPASTQNLWEGFRRWGAALRLMLFRTMRYVAEIMCGTFLGSVLFMVTPLSNKFIRATEAIAANPEFSQATPEELMAALTETVGVWDILPYYLLCIAGAAFLTIPLFYKYRLSDYALIDCEKPGAFLSIRISSQLMAGNRKKLFLLDLHFWWYYLLMLLSAVVAYGDLILPALGVALPMSENMALALFSFLSAIVQFIVYFFFRGRVETTYACVYASLKEPPQGGTEDL